MKAPATVEASHSPGRSQLSRVHSDNCSEMAGPQGIEARARPLPPAGPAHRQAPPTGSGHAGPARDSRSPISPKLSLLQAGPRGRVTTLSRATPAQHRGAACSAGRGRLASGLFMLPLNQDTNRLSRRLRVAGAVPPALPSLRPQRAAPAGAPRGAPASTCLAHGFRCPRVPAAERDSGAGGVCPGSPDRAPPLSGPAGPRAGAAGAHGPQEAGAAPPRGPTRFNRCFHVCQ